MHTIEPEQIEARKLYQEMGLTDEEYDRMKTILKRRPNYTETGIFSVMWSEHCSYKSSKPLLEKLPSKGPHVLVGPGEGAGVVDIGDDQAIVFKMESHNSPSAVEPFEGAATGVGGIVRDVFSMGAKPIALLNSLRFGSLENQRTKFLLPEVVRGLAHYGNTLEVPTVGGELQFDDCYEENPLVNAMCVGLINHDDIQKGIAAGPGNIVIYAGGDTGRDGIHGATFSSEEVAEGEGHTSAVAIGNPVMEKKLIEACLEVITSDALIGMQDMGAAGLTSSASEMASKAGTGMELQLDSIPQREEHMTAYEMMLSESQERMLLVAEKGREEEILAIFDKHDVPAIAIGQVTEEKTFRVIHQGEEWANIPVDALDEDAPVNHLPAKESASFRENQASPTNVPAVKDYAETFKELLKRPTIASKRVVYEQFEGAPLVAPGNGAGVVRIPGTDKAIALTTDCNSRYIDLDPETGGKIAVAEAARNIVCSGARPLGLTDGLNYGNPTNPEVFWQMKTSLQGISQASEALDVPVISGNVSLYNQSKDESIYPTPIIGMAGLLESIEHLTPSVFQQPDDLIFLIGKTKAEFGGSELQQMTQDSYEGKAPSIDLKNEQQKQAALLQAIQAGLVESATDLAEGGLAVALAESVFSDLNIGAHVQLKGDVTVQLFSETQTRFLVTIQAENKLAFMKFFPEAEQIGHVTEEETLSVLVNGNKVVEENTTKLSELWQTAIPNLLEK